MGRSGFLIIAALAAVSVAAPARAEELRAGDVTARIEPGAFRLDLEQRDGTAWRADAATARDAAGATSAVTRTSNVRRDGDALTAVLAFADGGRGTLRLAPGPGGSLAVVLTGPAQTAATGVRLVLADGEALFGSGERSDAVNRRGRTTENVVADGPYRAEDRVFTKAFSPPWAERDADDATYYPVPWLLSSRGWGVQVVQDETSRFVGDGEDGVRAEVDAGALRLHVFPGPTPAAALGRFTAVTGRQPPPAAPWSFGPWFQTGQPNVVPVEEERAITKAQRDVGAPVSVAETQMHYLPCGAHEGREELERERTASFHRDGLARLVYLNPSLCTSYRELYDRADAAGALQQVAGAGTFSYPAFVGGGGPIGFTSEPLAQFDFTSPATEPILTELVREVVATGNDGWMEDFGEGTPPFVTLRDGTTGSAAHNRTPVDYHCTYARIVKKFDRPLVRLQRSGWTGAAKCADVVWGGDPTTVWGFDGLRSAATQVLSAGLSGIARWGTDIGGYNSFGRGQAVPPGGVDETLTPELLTRWMELGALVPVMRTKRSGLAVPGYARPQVYDEDHLPDWRRLTELHLQLNRYLRAADDEHRRTGLPIVRHLVLGWPDQPEARRTDDAWMLGDDLLAAPVTAPGARERELWLPPGWWVSWWDAMRFDDRTGAYDLDAAPVVAGGVTRRVDAPLGRPPLFLRAGTILPLLSADIDTLTDYGSGLVHLADRRGVLRLAVLPRGTTSRRLGEGTTARSIERRRRWVLRVSGSSRTRYEVRAALGTLRRPFVPRRVLVGGRPVARKRWAYDRRSRVLRVAAAGRRVRIEVRG